MSRGEARLVDVRTRSREAERGDLKQGSKMDTGAGEKLPALIGIGKVVERGLPTLGA